MAQRVKNLLTLQETWVRSLGWEDPLKKGKAFHSSILAWRIPQTEEPGRLQFMRLQIVTDTTWPLTLSNTLGLQKQVLSDSLEDGSRAFYSDNRQMEAKTQRKGR